MENMDTVSQKSLYYTLNKNLNGETILQDIQKLIQKYNNGSQEYILTISLKPVTSTTNELIPKLEYIKEE
jgi:hypothetical protein